MRISGKTIIDVKTEEKKQAAAAAGRAIEEAKEGEIGENPEEDPNVVYDPKDYPIHEKLKKNEGLKDEEFAARTRHYVDPFSYQYTNYSYLKDGKMNPDDNNTAYGVAGEGMAPEEVIYFLKYLLLFSGLYLYISVQTFEAINKENSPDKKHVKEWLANYKKGCGKELDMTYAL